MSAVPVATSRNLPPVDGTVSATARRRQRRSTPSDSSRLRKSYRGAMEENISPMDRLRSVSRYNSLKLRRGIRVSSIAGLVFRRIGGGKSEYSPRVGPSNGHEEREGACHEARRLVHRRIDRRVPSRRGSARPRPGGGRSRGGDLRVRRRPGQGAGRIRVGSPVGRRGLGGVFEQQPDSPAQPRERAGRFGGRAAVPRRAIRPADLRDRSRGTRPSGGEIRFPAARGGDPVRPPPG